MESGGEMKQMNSNMSSRPATRLQRENIP